MLHKADYQGIAKSLGVRMATKNLTFKEAMSTIEDVAKSLEGTNPHYNAVTFSEFARQSFLVERKQLTFKKITHENMLMRGGQ